MAQIDLGSIKFNWKGSYSGATAYVVDDVVESSGSSYICIAATTGNAPPNATYWEQMSSAGTNGTDGTDLGTVLTTQGDLVYRDGSGLQRLGAGTSGQFLKTQGTGANPTWGDVSTNLADGTNVNTAYGLKAWINFNGTGTASIRGSGNISSLTDNGTGDFTISFTTSMPDANYGLAFMEYYSLSDGSPANIHVAEGRRISGSMVAGSFRVFTTGGSGATAQDHEVTTICVYR